MCIPVSQTCKNLESDVTGAQRIGYSAVIRPLEALSSQSEWVDMADGVKDHPTDRL